MTTTSYNDMIYEVNESTATSKMARIAPSRPSEPAGPRRLGISEETKAKWKANREILEAKGIKVNGIITDIVRDFWLMAKESGYDDIRDDLCGLHLARCLNRMEAKRNGS